MLGAQILGPDSLYQPAVVPLSVYIGNRVEALNHWTPDNIRRKRYDALSTTSCQKCWF